MREMKRAHRRVQRIERTVAGSRETSLTDSGFGPAFVAEVEQVCEDCGGSGCDIGSVRPLEPEICQTCGGTGKQMVTRNYLAEGFRIAAGASSRAIEREHLRAIIQYCRWVVGAATAISEMK